MVAGMYAGEARTGHWDAEYFQGLCFENVDLGRFPILREPATSSDGETSEAAEPTAARPA